MIEWKSASPCILSQPVHNFSVSQQDSENYIISNISFFPAQHPNNNSSEFGRRRCVLTLIKIDGILQNQASRKATFFLNCFTVFLRNRCSFPCVFFNLTFKLVALIQSIIWAQQKPKWNKSPTEYYIFLKGAATIRWNCCHRGLFWSILCRQLPSTNRIPILLFKYVTCTLMFISCAAFFWKWFAVLSWAWIQHRVPFDHFPMRLIISPFVSRISSLWVALFVGWLAVVRDNARTHPMWWVR